MPITSRIATLCLFIVVAVLMISFIASELVPLFLQLFAAISKTVGFLLAGA